MNVTKENFSAAVTELEQLLPTAAFVAIDEEMTGIHLPGVFVERMSDSTEERYVKMKSVAETYKIIQIGLCLFHEETPASSDSTAPPRFAARPYNFWLFPEEGAVNMEAAAIAFNKTHGMDFNKWIYEGIPYLTNEAHDALIQKFYGGAEGWQKEQVRAGRAQPDAAAMSDAASSSLPVEKKEEKPKKQIKLEREADIQYLSEVQSRIFEWLGKRAPDEHEMQLPDANSFLRLAVYQWLETLTQEQLSAKVPNVAVDRANVFLDTRSQPDQKWKSTFHVMHWTKAEKDEQDALALAKKRREFDAKVGFKLVWDLLRTARAPIVVHNGFFDVLFMYTHFESAQLPPTLPEFKQALGRIFPAGVFDTKFLSNSRQFAFPFEFLSQRLAAATANGTPLTEQDQQRLERFKAMSLSESALTAARFRETHLEKLYFALKKEGEARIVAAKAANAPASAAAPAPVAAPVSSSGPRSFAAASPPPPLSEVVVTMAPSFDKYAMVGQPGGDDSKAHEAGYDAFMTAVIFASFAAEAPMAEILAPLRANRAANISSVADSARAMQASPWLGRIPLFRHLLALDLNVDPTTGLPRADSLVDPSSVVYLMRGFPAEWRAEDIAHMFEGNYTCAKRKMGEGHGNDNGKEEKKKTEAQAAAAASSDASAMVDVAPSAAAEDSSAAPLPVIVTAAPKFIWIDDVSLFLTIPLADQAKFEAFLAANANGANTAVVPAGISITKFAGGTQEEGKKAADSAASAATASA